MPRLSHVTERGRGTLLELREALFALMSEKDFAEITIKDITDRAQIDRSTFYLHCSDKHDLLLQGQQQMIHDLFAQVPTEAPLEERLRRTFVYMADHVAAYRALLVHADNSSDHIMESFVADYVARALKDGPLHISADDATLELLAHAVTNLIRGVAKWWLATPEPIPAQEAAHLVQQLILQGLSGFSQSATTMASQR